MKQPSTLVLRVAIILVGTLVLTICIFGLPRAVGTFQMGGYDPILLSLYAPAVPFFITLYMSMKILGRIDKQRAFSLATVEAFRVIKYCALVISGLFAAGIPYIFHVAEKDDAPGVVAMALVIVFLSFVIGVFASVMQKLFQTATNIKSENDLTV